MKVDFELPEWAEPFTAPARYKVAYGGRGSTKSWTFARIIAFRASIEPLRVLCARETQKAIAESVHEVLKDQIAAIGLADQYEFKADSIEHKVTGSRFVYTGLKQHTAANLKSYENFDICWVAEAHKVSKVSWDILEPTIRKAGSEFWIDLNPELDTDETYDRFVLNPPKGAIVAHVNWRDNPWWNDILEQQRLRTKLRDPDGYENIWEGKPRAAIEGAIYAQELDRLQREGRFTSVKHDPLLKTHTVWDLGWNDQTVILLVQRAASELRVICAYISRFSTYEQDIAELRKLEGKPGFEGLNWGTDWMPHDARAKTKTSGGKSAEEIVKRLGRKVEVVPLHDVESGIKLTRTIFGRMWVDNGAKDWFNALKRYHRHVSTDGKKTGDPVHDDASHGADALRYLAHVADKLHNHQNSAVARIEYPNLGMPADRVRRR